MPAGRLRPLGPERGGGGAVVFGALLISGALTALLMGEDGTPRFWTFLLGVFVPGWSLLFALWAGIKRANARAIVYVCRACGFRKPRHGGSCPHFVPEGEPVPLREQRASPSA